MKSMQDKCGLFGLWSTEQCVGEVLQGIDFLQHRGQEYCGIATMNKGIRQVTHYGKVANTFKDDELRYLKGTTGIGHVSLWERQPVRYRCQLGEIALAFSGNVINFEDLIQDMGRRGKAFVDGYDIEIISKIIMERKDLVEGICALSEKVVGAYCECNSD